MWLADIFALSIDVQVLEHIISIPFWLAYLSIHLAYGAFAHLHTRKHLVEWNKIKDSIDLSQLCVSYRQAHIKDIDLILLAVWRLLVGMEVAIIYNIVTLARIVGLLLMHTIGRLIKWFATGSWRLSESELPFFYMFGWYTKPAVLINAIIRNQLVGPFDNHRSKAQKFIEFIECAMVWHTRL